MHCLLSVNGPFPSIKQTDNKDRLDLMIFPELQSSGFWFESPVHWGVFSVKFACSPHVYSLGTPASYHSPHLLILQ